MQDHYSKTFFRDQMERSRMSAQEMVPVVLQMVNVKSVVDVGCGMGTWLSVFKEKGITDILGMDGEWVDQKMMMITSSEFINKDLTQPIKLDRKFDLAVSMEVGEHLEERFADTFVRSLTDLAPIILFSAAIPMQGGRHHVNEQWPMYWSNKFRKHDYFMIDCLRKKIWNNENIGSWYAQNSFLIVSKDVLPNYPALQSELREMDPEMLSLVHPRLFESEMKRYESLRKNYSIARKILFPVWWIGKLGKRIFSK